MRSSVLVALFCAPMLSGCISTQELPLAPNVVRLDTQARGLLFTGQTVPQTMRAAALATLNRGYTHFKFADANLNQGSVVAGVYTAGQGTAAGTYGGGIYNASARGTSSSTVISAPTSSAAVTVIMFHADDAGAKDAFSSEDVLKQYPQ